MLITCPNCDRKYTLRDWRLGDLVQCPNCLTDIVFRDRPGKTFEIRLANGQTVQVPVHDDQLFSAVFSVVGRRSGASPEFLAYTDSSVEGARRFARDRSGEEGRINVGDVVAIEFSSVDVPGTDPQHALVLSVNGQRCERWGVLSDYVGSLVVRYRGLGAEAVIDCVPRAGKPDLSPYESLGEFVELPKFGVGERMEFSVVIVPANLPEATGGFDWSQLGG